MARVELLQRPLPLLAAAVLLHLSIISAQVTTSSGLPLVQAVAFGAVAEMQRLVMATGGAVADAWQGYVALRGAHEDNRRLRGAVQQLELRLQEERALAQQAAELRRLLDLKAMAPVATTAADIIGASGTSGYRAILINKGRQDGIDADMAILSTAGVVGRVAQPGLHTAKVQLLMDRTAAIGALVERSRAQGVVAGTGDQLLQLQYVSGLADVRQGDVVVSSGIDGVYPPGFVIGTVVLVDRGPASYREIRIRPAVDVTQVGQVLVVTEPTRRAGDTAGAVQP
ncbi:MAG: rod shape-determining protein MreC [Acidobacteria bacterium]|nr:rod shape-determining protein MreC [Acidobacteriota bacterium]